MAMIRVDLQVETDAQPPVTGVARNLVFVLEVIRNPILLVALLALGGGVFWALKTTKQLSATEAEISASVDQQQRDSVKFAAELKNAEKLKLEQSEYETLVARVRGLDDNRFAFLHLMDEAARALPPESWLHSIETIKDDSLTRNVSATIKGFTPTEGAVTEYLQRLNESPWVTNAVLVQVERTPVNRQTLVSFEVTVDTEIPDPSFFRTTPVSQLFGATVPNLPGTTGNGAAPITQMLPGRPNQE